MKIKPIQKIVLAGIFLAIAFVLPFFTGSNQALGQMLLLMHIPVILCGFICGPKYGALIGFISPLLRFLILGMPPIYPIGLAMSFELATYGFISGLLYSVFKKHIGFIYLTLIIAMILGRAIWGLSMLILLSFGADAFTFTAFLGGAFITAFPGIIIQIVAIPLIIFAIEKIQEKNYQEA